MAWHGTARGCTLHDGFVEGMRNTDWNAAMSAAKQTMLSDMIFALYFAETSPPTIAASVQHAVGARRGTKYEPHALLTKTTKNPTHTLDVVHIITL